MRREERGAEGEGGEREEGKGERGEESGERRGQE